MEKDIHTNAFLSKLSAAYSLTKEAEQAYSMWSKTHKEVLTEDVAEEIAYLTSSSARIMDVIGRDAYEVQQEKVARLTKKK